MGPCADLFPLGTATQLVLQSITGGGCRVDTTKCSNEGELLSTLVQQGTDEIFSLLYSRNGIVSTSIFYIVSLTGQLVLQGVQHLHVQVVVDGGKPTRPLAVLVRR